MPKSQKRSKYRVTARGVKDKKDIFTIISSATLWKTSYEKNLRYEIRKRRTKGLRHENEGRKTCGTKYEGRRNFVTKTKDEITFSTKNEITSYEERKRRTKGLRHENENEQRIARRNFVTKYEGRRLRHEERKQTTNCTKFTY